MPNAASPSPVSSGCWCPRALVARFLRLTRLGRRGVSVRLLRRRAMRACFDAAPVFPLAALLLLELLGGAALCAVHRRGHGVLRPRRFEVGPPLARAQARERLLCLHRITRRPAPLELRDRARELRVLALES